MSINAFTVKAGPDGKAKFQIIIPVQYCTLDLFRDISLTVVDKNKQNIAVKKAGLQFETELSESTGDYKYTLLLKKNGEEIDNREIAVKIVSGENREKSDTVIRYKESRLQLKEMGINEIYSSYFNEKDDLLLVGTYKNLELFKKSTLEHIETLSGHSHSVTAIFYEKSSDTYLTAGIDKTVRWDMTTKSPIEIITNFNLHYGPARGFFKDNNKMYFVYSENTSKFLVQNLYDKTDEIPVDKTTETSCVKYDEKTRNLFYGNSRENSIIVFSITNNSLIQQKIMLESGIIRNITFIPGDKYFMTYSTGSDHLKIWITDDWKLYKKVPVRKEPYSGDVADVIIDNKSAELLIIYKTGIIDVYDWYGIN